ncbi:ROK family transcriptional regulator [Aureimonas sp. Leaf454]|uniref:ROK family transcriptional regulator n=1 Tax=Aureimonas sp. Leaf454 TaxID=1736381 RepID=UPI0006F71FF4|nr:ROK family transcriptional regulator [Aureimonas sp. Leaf454]KQT47609.1 ROK family transcriptional regulator [Aureimonas sp. Leaf454]
MDDLASIASSPRRVRQSNEVAALRALHQFGRLSRAELARKLKLNRSSSGHIIAGLTADGLVREVVRETPSDQPERAGPGRAGRPGILLQLVPEAIFFLGVEIGVEHISVVELDLEAKIVGTSVEPLDGPSIGVEAAVERAVSQAFKAIPRERWDRCEGVGVSVPAQMDKTGLVRVAPLLGWREIRPAEIVRSALPIKVPVLAENDANAFAIGATYGQESSISGVTLFLVMESGVGGGIIVDGTLLRGAHGLAGEIGHLRGAGADRDRMLEEIVGLEAMKRAYRAASGLPKASFERFVSDVRDRVPAAVTVAEDWAKALAFGIVQACRIIDPDRIVLGGSGAALYPLVATRVASHMARSQEASFPIPSITVYGEAAFGAAFGAACMMHQKYLSLESQRYAEEQPDALAVESGGHAA